MIKLVEINVDNFDELLAIKVKSIQKEYLPEISYFLARAYINLKYHYPDYCFGIEYKQKLIGFTKIVLVPANESPLFLSEDTYLLDALIIDEVYQGKGFGKSSLKKIIEFLSTHPMGKVDRITLMCHFRNNEALNLYKRFDFSHNKNHELGDKSLLLFEKNLNR